MKKAKLFLQPVTQLGFWRPGQATTMAAPDRNGELQKNKYYLFTFLLFD
jgi:hypothetical protein